MRRGSLLLLLLGLAALTAPGALAHHPAGSMAEDAARGVQYDGLRPASDEGPCRGVGYEITGGVNISCTHGPDPAPEGVDVRESRSLEELRAGTESSEPVPCIGDGVSGERVQAVYAYPTGQPNRISVLRTLIEGWAAEANDIVRASAAQQGGTRDVRFVTDESCRLSVLDVGLPVVATGADFGATITALIERGLNRPGRKYLVWMDANALCGIAQSYEDPRPFQFNLNNGYAPLGLVARIDRGCWADVRGVDRDHVETHELVHTLGAVLDTAPHGSAAGHCVDDFDVMCYDDDLSPGTYPMRNVCGNPVSERRLDCGGDDYFNVSPAPGSWLAANWNTANSAFLERGPQVSLVPQPTNLRVASATETYLAVEWTPGSGAAAESYDVYLNGARLRTTSAPRFELPALTCGSKFKVGVEAIDSGMRFSLRTTAEVATLACPDRQPPVVTPFAASGKRGQIVRLRYGVSDAAQTRETVTIYRGAKRLKTLTTAFGPSTSNQSVGWRVPRTATGPLRFCVRATDRGGNPSIVRCAAIRLT